MGTPIGIPVPLIIISVVCFRPLAERLDCGSSGLIFILCFLNCFVHGNRVESSLIAILFARAFNDVWVHYLCLSGAHPPSHKARTTHTSAYTH